MNFKSIARYLICLVTLSYWAVSYASPLQIRYLADSDYSDNGNRNFYPIALLKLVLSKAGKDYELVPVEKRVPQDRALILLGKGNRYDIMWSMTSPEREQDYRPIRFSIDKGMIGMRMLLIREGEQERFNHIKSLRELQELTAGQAHDWPDTKILKANGIEVVTSSSYLGLFQMLKIGRYDFFPRSAEEIWLELDHHKGDGLTVEKNLLLRYPTKSYFFVAKENHELAELLENGLVAAEEDGSFDALFYEHFEKIVERTKGRHIIELQNPDYSDDN